MPVQIGEVSRYASDPIVSRQSIDYRNPTAATRSALLAALNDHAAHRAELPDPLPEGPLSRSRTCIDSAESWIETSSPLWFRPKSSESYAVRSTRNKSQPAKATATDRSMVSCVHCAADQESPTPLSPRSIASSVLRAPMKSLYTAAACQLERDH